MISASLCLLSACFEVKDDSNADVAAAIQAQNEILSETNTPNTSSDVKPTVALMGIIVDASDNQEVSAANITVIAADVIIQDSLAFESGEFKIENLPSSSDITLIISSSDNSFLARTFFINTGYSNTENTANDYGTFKVSEAIDVQVTVINKTTGLPFSELEFMAYSHFGTSSRVNQYKHTSTYDEVNGVYNISLPKFLNVMTKANLDINKDGEVDFIPESTNNLSGNDLFFYSGSTQESFTVYLKEKKPLAEIEYRVTLIDESANTLLGAELTATGSDGVESISTYDEVTKQYVLAAKLGNSSTIEIPSFTVNDVDYQSSSININMNGDESLSVNVSGTSNHSYYNIPYSNIIELAVMPRVINYSTSTLEVVTAANKVNFVDHSFSVFYSQPVTASASNVSLINTSGFTVVKGNDDSNDIVLPGTTIVTGNVDIPVTFQTSLNNTKLTVTPVNTLTTGQNYKYDISSLVVKTTEELVDVSGDFLSFSIENNGEVAFDINEVRLDNNNYTKNGMAILTTNSAGDAASPYNNDNNVHFYLPSSIETLQTLSFRLVSITKDGVSANAIRDYNLVMSGNRYSLSTIGLVQLAENETLVSNNLNINIDKGTAQADSQKVYRFRTYNYTSDDLENSENSMTFEYAYETKAGVISTGVITIPVQ
jgi:hypothetical protein